MGLAWLSGQPHPGAVYVQSIQNQSGNASVDKIKTFQVNLAYHFECGSPKYVLLNTCRLSDSMPSHVQTS